MEKTFNVGVIVMESYKKPAIVSESAPNQAAPAVAAAFLAGVGAGLARGKIKIDSLHTQALKVRKANHD